MFLSQVTILYNAECSSIFYMYICRILPVQLLGCHIEINACDGKTTWHGHLFDDVM